MHRWLFIASALLFASCSTYQGAFEEFSSSAYLQRLWDETCVYPLTQENLILLAHTTADSLDCQWHREPTGVNPTIHSLQFPEEVSDIDGRWYGCSDTTAPLIWDAVQNPGSNMVHLGDGLRPDADEAYVLVAKCHYWTDNYCDSEHPNPHCSYPNREEIMSVAYAVYDPQTGEIHW